MKNTIHITIYTTNNYKIEKKSWATACRHFNIEFYDVEFSYIYEYEGEPPINETLESLVDIFRLSVSNIVKINDSYYYCDFIGFKRIPDSYLCPLENITTNISDDDRDTLMSALKIVNGILGNIPKNRSLVFKTSDDVFTPPYEKLEDAQSIIWMLSQTIEVEGK